MENSKFRKKEGQLAIRVSVNSIFVNLTLMAFKLYAGIWAKSDAMISDAVHSASDVFSTLIVIVGVKISGKEADQKHQYGHERMECMASLLLAVFLCLSGLGIGINGIVKISNLKSHPIETPGMLALFAAILSILVKEGMYWYTRNAAKKIHSIALMADAWHHRSDAMSSVGSFLGILGARIGFPVLDPAAGVIISVCIIKVAYDIFRDSSAKLIDESCDEETVTKMREEVKKQEGVIRIDDIRTRKFGSRVYVDIEIRADGAMSLHEAHAAAEAVHNSIEEEFPEVKHCMVHVNPE